MLRHSLWETWARADVEPWDAGEWAGPSTSTTVSHYLAKSCDQKEKGKDCLHFSCVCLSLRTEIIMKEIMSFNHDYVKYQKGIDFYGWVNRCGLWLSKWNFSQGYEGVW